MSYQMITSENTQAQPHLFRLPAELRNMIYERALEATHTIIESSGLCNSSQPGLLLACKQTREEAVQLFYAHTIFQFPAQQGIDLRITKWFSSLRPEFSSLVRQVALDTDLHSWTTGEMGARKPITSPYVKVRRIHCLRARVVAVLPQGTTVLVNIWTPKASLADRLSDNNIMEACRGCLGEMESVWTTNPMAENKHRIAAIRAKVLAKQES
ncbi:hypothetical protein Slin15195_G105300 [Septoria linicola]|uniref:Uncharacterized protein n=1 Tax=Septoria linicola TaxID=215465 RepID=A0A9Q9EMY2_9PEZI|nr:hypothetical protein Slin15195_G105300 [Septoria linicola]